MKLILTQEVNGLGAAGDVGVTRGETRGSERLNGVELSIIARLFK